MSQFSLLRQRRFLPFFVTQFLGAFNDNVFKNALMFLLTFQAAEALALNTNIMLNLAALLFILPFFLFSAIAGQCCDKFEKSRLIRFVKFAEIVIMSLAAVALLFEAYWVLLALLFLMGTQSTFFGPAKYAILPQHLENSELVGGNALVEMGTFAAILLGTIAAGMLMALEQPTPYVAMAVLVFAVLGYLASRAIPVAKANAPELTLSYRIIAQTMEMVRTTRETRSIFLAIVAISWFWFLGAAYLTQFPNFAKVILQGDTSAVTLLLFVFTLGIGVGSMCCEKLSGSRIELGIVPIGSLGLTFCGVALYFSIPPSPSAEITWQMMLDQGHYWSLLWSLFGIGFFGGVFIVPLYAFVQERAPEHYRARTIAVINIMNALFMVGSAIAGIVFLGLMGLDIPEFFLILAIMNVVVCCYVFYQVDEFALRFMVWMLSHTLYRVKHVNLDVIPAEGPAVLVCNHVSYADAPLIAGACPRPIRFVMDHQIFKTPGMGAFFRLSKAIPIAPKGKNEAIYNAAFDEVSKALRNRELVMIFPEGKLTRNGEMNPFRQGIERILACDPVPVVTLGLQGLWGSIFSHKDGSALAKWPKRFWSRVTIVGGACLPPEGVTAADLEDKVAVLVNNQS